MHKVMYIIYAEIHFGSRNSTNNCITGEGICPTTNQGQE
jgi:hypothetical protein